METIGLIDNLSKLKNKMKKLPRFKVVDSRPLPNRVYRENKKS